jgi:hypothetical protein
MLLLFLMMMTHVRAREEAASTQYQDQNTRLRGPSSSSSFVVSTKSGHGHGVLLTAAGGWGCFFWGGFLSVLVIYLAPFLVAARQNERILFLRDGGRILKYAKKRSDDEALM